MIWLMRRPFMRRLQRLYLDRVPDERREEATRKFYKHESLARRIGLPLVTALVQFFIAAAAITICYRLALEGINRGWIILPPSSEQFQKSSEA